MSFLAPLAQAIDYVNGLNKDYSTLSLDQQKDLGFLGRIKAYNWSFELVVVGIMFALFVIAYSGKSMNNKYADKIFGTLNDFLLTKLFFAKVGFNADGKKMMYVEEQNNTWFTSFATGRSTIESVIIKAHLQARHNPLAVLTQKVLSYFFSSFIENDTEEFISVTVTPNGQFVASEEASLSSNVSETLSKFKFITSIVNKAVMTKARDSNYFLSLTHTSESEALPSEYVFMSESNKLNDFIPAYFGPTLNDLLSKSSKFLQFIAFTDLPEEKPITDKLWETNQLPRCVIYLNLITSDNDLELLQQIIVKIVEIYDTFTKDIQSKSPNALVTNEILKKGVQLRKDELNKIIKVMKQVEREMALEKKQEEEKQKRKDLRNKLTDEELDKLDQKKKEKRERRLRNKQKMRM